MDLPEFKLISFPLCPYVQRARGILVEKNIAHDIEYIDLQEPPAWFYDISPLEKVPVLLVDGKPLFESLAICEYLDEITPGTLHPEDAFNRALNRAWIEFGNDVLSLTFRFYTTNDQDVYKQLEVLLLERFETFEEFFSGEPFFNGTKFCIIDMVYAPLIRFHHAITKYSDKNFLADAPKLTAWGTRLLDYPAVVQSVPDDYDAILETYLRKQESIFGAYLS